MADKIIRNSKLDTFLSKLATKLVSIFWRKAETTQVSIDNAPTASSNNLVKSGGVYDFVKPQMQKNSLPSGGLIPEVLYFTTFSGGSVTVSLATPADPSVENTYKLMFGVQASTTITWPMVVWAGDCLDSNGLPVIVPGKVYKVLITLVEGAGFATINEYQGSLSNS